MSAISVMLRVIALTFVLFVCYGVGSGLALSGVTQPDAGGSPAMSLVVVCVLQTIVLSYLILRSRWSGWGLMLAIFFIFYGVATFMPQIESAFFLATQLPAGMVARLFLMGFLVAAPFSVLAVIILGMRKPEPTDNQRGVRLGISVSVRVWKLAVIALGYVILYFTFGYFIAWRNPAVREYYGGTDPGSFLAQMQNVVRDRPWLIPFQVLRAMCWVAIALPIVRMLKGDWREIALALGITFAVLMNAQLLLPNPYMPESVRMAHLVETASSNFIFGLLVGWLLTEHHANATAPMMQGAV